MKTLKRSKKHIPLFKVFMPKSVRRPLLKTLFSGWIGQGPRVDEFENLLSKRFKTRQLVTVNSGTSALQLAVKLAGVKPDDEVITTPLTCTATNWAILACGGKLVWADVDELTANIDPKTIEPLIGKKTKAIMVVHWGGLPCDLDKIHAIAKKHKLKVIEDCAHAFGAAYKGRPIGTHSDFAAFSFQAIKNLTTVDGGLLIVKDPKQFKRAKRLRWFGIDRFNLESNIKQNISEWGYKFQMNDVLATIGIEQLKYVDRIVKKNRANAEFYNRKLKNIPEVELLKTFPDRKSSYWLYTLKVDRRVDFIRKMKQRGIQVSRVHNRSDKYSTVKTFKRHLPQLDRFNKKNICIPVGWWLSKKERQYIVNMIKQGW